MAVAKADAQRRFAPNGLGQEGAEVGKGDLIQHFAEAFAEQFDDEAPRLRRKEAIDFDNVLHREFVMQQFLRDGCALHIAGNVKQRGCVILVDGSLDNAEFILRDDANVVEPVVMGNEVAQAFKALTLLIICLYACR